MDLLSQLSCFSQILNELIFEHARSLQPLNGMVQAHCEKVVAVDGLHKCLVLANLQVHRIDEDLKDDAEAIDEE